MKSLAVKLGVSLLVLGLTFCSTEAWSAEWKELAEATTGIFQYDAASISSSSQGLVRVWIHNASKRETSLVEFNCKGGIYRVLDVAEYDEASRIKAREDYYDNPYWLSVTPKSVPESLQKVVCR
jgi:hypothetical protein